MSTYWCSGDTGRAAGERVTGVAVDGGKLTIRERQVAIRWPGPPRTDAELDRRAKLLDEIAAVRTPRRPRSRGRAAVLLERDGARELAVEGSSARTPRAWIVRVYYESQAGEALAFDCGPLTEDQARGVFASYGYNAVQHAQGPDDRKLTTLGRGNGSVLGVAAYQVDQRPTARREPLPLRDGARLVRLPSQLRADDSGAVRLANHRLGETIDRETYDSSLTPDASAVMVGS